MDVFGMIVLLLAWAIGLVLLYVIIKAAVLGALRQHALEAKRAGAEPVDPTPAHLHEDGL